MQDYDFKALNDKEFETLCIDLIGVELGKRFERFKPGKDSGVDGRFFEAPGQELIIQCKHWISTPIEQLIKSLNTKERPKVDKLKPKKYFLAVSNPLSRADKAAIRNALKPHITSDNDIFGREDLNDLLSRHKSIELRHYKLWISSTNVLKGILNKAILDRSSFTIKEALENSKTYALTSNHEKAIQKLENLGIIIITGEPGIGKTTLAEQICLNFAAKDYQVIKISDEIKEAESIYQEDSKQLFYFDDFLGRNYLEALSGHEGSHIVNFIKRISRDKKTKRFILTSRSTILNQGKTLIDLLTNQNIDKNEYELSASLLSELDKARILYNHIWHSELSPDHKEQIYLHRRYREIIKHPNFNPRLIRFVLDSERITHITHSEYWNYILETLKNPIDVWDNPFNAQQDDFSRAITLIVALNNRPIDEADLCEAYFRFISMPENSNLKGRRDFTTNIKHLTGSLLSRTIKKDSTNTSLDLFNPSLGDYLLNRYSKDTPTLRSTFLSLRSTSSLASLKNLASNKIITKESNIEIQVSILENSTKLNFSSFTSEYISEVLNNIYDTTKTTNTHIQSAISFITKEPVPRSFKHTAKAITLALQEKIITPELASNFIIDACNNNPNNEELEQLLKTYQLLSEENHPTSVIRSFLEESIASYFAENIHSELEDNDVFRNLHYSEINLAEDNLSNLIHNRLSALGVDWEIDCELILDAYDIYSRRDIYFSIEEDQDHRIFSNQKSYTDEIDDLFFRDQ